MVKETLRLRPVFSVVGRRLKAPMQIGGVPLPAGVTVVPSIYLMHRRADLSTPTRDDSGRSVFLSKRAGTYTWIPFGGGVRRCLGAAFAEYEMCIVLSTLFDSCTVRPTNERPEPVRRALSHPRPRARSHGGAGMRRKEKQAQTVPLLALTVSSASACCTHVCCAWC